MQGYTVLTRKIVTLNDTEAREITKEYLNRHAKWKGDDIMIRDGVVHVEQYHPGGHGWFEVLRGVDPNDPELIFAVMCYHLHHRMEQEDRAKTR